MENFRIRGNTVTPDCSQITWIHLKYMTISLYNAIESFEFWLFFALAEKCETLMVGSQFGQLITRKVFFFHPQRLTYITFDELWEINQKSWKKMKPMLNMTFPVLLSRRKNINFIYKQYFMHSNLKRCVFFAPKSF